MLGCNRAYCDFWGCDKSTVVGRNTLKIHAHREAEVHIAKDAEAYDSHEAVRYELTVQDADNKAHQVIFQKAPFLDQDNRLAGLIGVILDITKERQADKFRRDFISTVAHEFQTPLATIIGFAELLQQGSLEGTVVQDSLHTIISKAEVLSGMIGELLDLSRIEAGKTLCINPEYTDLRPVLIKTLENFQVSHTKHAIVTVIPDQPLKILADQERLLQVLDNLLSNASKYSAPGTRIEFIAEPSEQGLNFTVTDQGIGMNREQCSHLFEKFYRADTSNTAPSGTGLGLYICKAIVVAHGGEIQINSSPGKGTQVIVSLPLAGSQHVPD
jgi:PAS domain S-box-containing protein